MSEIKHLRRSGTFNVNFGDILHLVLVFLLLTLSEEIPAGRISTYQKSIFNFKNLYFNPIQDGFFRGKKTYPTVMKLGTVIPYLTKIQKMYKSRETSLEFC